jgi:hypothetical protein
LNSLGLLTHLWTLHYIILIVENLDLYSLFEELYPIYTTLTRGKRAAEKPGRAFAKTLSATIGWAAVAAAKKEKN